MLVHAAVHTTGSGKGIRRQLVFYTYVPAALTFPENNSAKFSVRKYGNIVAAERLDPYDADEGPIKLKCELPLRIARKLERLADREGRLHDPKLAERIGLMLHGKPAQHRK